MCGKIVSINCVCVFVFRAGFLFFSLFKLEKRYNVGMQIVLYIHCLGVCGVIEEIFVYRRVLQNEFFQCEILCNDLFMLHK